MKHFIIAFLLLFSYGLNAQTNSSSSSFPSIGKYSGYSKPYSMGVIAGKQIMVPGSQNTFVISSNNTVSLTQVSDEGLQVLYRGKFTSVKTADGSPRIICKVVEVSNSKYLSQPCYHIVLNPDGTITCHENPDAKIKTPPFELKKG